MKYDHLDFCLEWTIDRSEPSSTHAFAWQRCVLVTFCMTLLVDTDSFMQRISQVFGNVSGRSACVQCYKRNKTDKIPKPTSASAAAWRRFIDIELSERRARNKFARTESTLLVASVADPRPASPLSLDDDLAVPAGTVRSGEREGSRRDIFRCLASQLKRA